MLDEAGRMDFAEEVLGLVERLWSTFESTQGGAEDRKQQLVGLAYIIAVLRQDIGIVWDQVINLPEVRDLRLKELLAKELGTVEAAHGEAVRAAMRRHGWVE